MHFIIKKTNQVVGNLLIIPKPAASTTETPGEVVVLAMRVRKIWKK